MNRTQLAILAAVGTAAGLAWTAVLMHSVVDGVADEAVASPPGAQLRRSADGR